MREQTITLGDGTKIDIYVSPFSSDSISVAGLNKAFKIFYGYTNSLLFKGNKVTEVRGIIGSRALLTAALGIHQ